MLLFCGLFFILSIHGAVGVPKAPPEFSWDAIKYVHAFGDSYSFVQGTGGFPNFSFIGDALNLPFTPVQLLTDEIIPRNTSSEGSNWLEFLTGCFEGRPSACWTQLWDFSFAGADIDAGILPRHHNYTASLVDQVNQWVTYASNVIPHPLGQTLTTWWIGINDTGDTVSNTTVRNAFINMIHLHRATKNADYRLRSILGVRNNFLFQGGPYDNGLQTHLFINVPPGDRAPASLGNPTKAATQKLHINQYNSVLAKYIKAFAASNPGATVLSFDANTWFNSILDSPASYGFTNVTGFCTCMKPTGFFWYNSGHPTEAVHKLLASAIEAQLQSSSFY